MTKSTYKDIEIINAKLPGYQDLQQIRINGQGKIEVIKPMGNLAQSRSHQKLIDFAGDWLSLGGVDLQINGGLGLAFPDLEKHHLPFLKKICQFLWSQGVDGFLPTIVTTSIEKIQRSLSVITEFIESQPSELTETAQIFGVHLEGPFLNREKRGAHQEEHLLPLTIDNIKQVLGDYAQTVKVITLAPELDSTREVIPYLRSLGIIVSLGHSLATAIQAQEAFAQGASMVTHAFNAMPGLHHRKPGLLGAALVHPQVKCGLIADGKHVSPTIIQVLLRAGCYDQGIFLVSDALAPIGLPDGIYPWDKRQIEVKDGTARLPNGTLSGTTLPLLVGVENLLKWGICKPEGAIILATESPRQAIGLSGLGIGKSATELVRWHWEEDSSKLSWRRLNRSSSAN